MNKRTRLRSPSLILCGLIAAAAAISPASAQHAGGGGHAAVGHGGFGHYGGGYRGGYRGGWGYGWVAGAAVIGDRGVGAALGLGLYFATLPLYYSTLWWDGIPYYYADNTYYRWNGAVNQYETVSPPPGLEAEGPSASASELIAYPKNGQSKSSWGRISSSAIAGPPVRPGSTPRRRQG